MNRLRIVRIFGHNEVGHIRRLAVRSLTPFLYNIYEVIRRINSNLVDGMENG